jgi:hypothetical protein
MKSNRKEHTVSDKKIEQFRQGDILFERLAEIPKGFKYDPERSASNRIVLAEGEVTGHYHEVLEDESTVVLSPTESKAIDELILHVRAPGGTEVKHPEHAPVPLPQGIWKVSRQREYEHGSETREKEARAAQVRD